MLHLYLPKTHIHNSHVQQLYINYNILLRIIPPLLVTSCYIPFYDQYDPFNDQYFRSQLDFFANSHVIWVWYGRNWEPQNPLVPKIWGSLLFDGHRRIILTQTQHSSDRFLAGMGYLKDHPTSHQLGAYPD